MDNDIQCHYCHGAAYTTNPFTVITQMGRAVRVVFNYCPLCGRQLMPQTEEWEFYVKEMEEQNV